jgi:hypothetical protein
VGQQCLQQSLGALLAELFTEGGCNDELVIALKAFFDSFSCAALVLTPTKAGLQPGDLLSINEVEQVIQIPGVNVDPSMQRGTAGGRGNIAQVGEIELRERNLFFVARQASRTGSDTYYRVNLQSGEIELSSGARPHEIYSEWSLVRTDGQTETLYEHKRRPD